MRGFSLLLTILASIVAVAHAYTNPILPGFNPDPSIIQDGDDYWLVVSSFEYFPGLPIYHSTDLVNWTLHSHALTRASQLPLYGTPSSLGSWAPTIRKHKGRFYIANSKYDTISPNVPPKGFYVYTDDIESGTWSEPVYFDTPGFDHDLFFDDDGSVYLGWTKPKVVPSDLVECFTSKIDLATGKTITTPQLLVNVTVLWPEGSHVYKINGTYYLNTAAGGTSTNSHQELSYRSTVSPFGPWTANPANPVLKATSGSIITRTGHADMVEDKNGNWWGVFLGVRLQGSIAQLGRETNMVPVTWKDGWPIFNDGLTTPVYVPELYNLTRPTSWVDNFTSGKSLDLGWYQLRTPIKKDYTLSERKGYLRVYGNAYNLTQPVTPSLYLRKQTSLNTVFSTQLEFTPKKSVNATSEAGVVLWLSEASHQSLGVTLCSDGSGNRCLVSRIYSGNVYNWTEKSVTIANTGAINLYIKAQPTQYTLQYSLNGGGNVTDFVSFANTAIDSSSTFTGAFFGLYSVGNGFPVMEAADFAYARTDEILS